MKIHNPDSIVFFFRCRLRNMISTPRVLLFLLISQYAFLSSGARTHTLLSYHTCNKRARPGYACWLTCRRTIPGHFGFSPGGHFLAGFWASFCSMKYFLPKNQESFQKKWARKREGIKLLPKITASFVLCKPRCGQETEKKVISCPN